MPKPHKIKRSSGRRRKIGARPHPLAVVFTAVLALGLLYLGVVLYGPVSDFIRELSNPPPSSLPPEPPSSSVPEPSSTPPPAPEPDPLPEMPEQVRAVRMPLETALYQSSWDPFLAGLPADCNTVLVEAKDAQGSVLFRSGNEDAAKWNTLAAETVDLAALAGYLEENGLYLGVRMSAFCDPAAARADKLRNAILHTSGVTWLDNSVQNGGKPWLNPYAESVRGYLSALAAEAAEQGASLVLFDNFQFPQDPTRSATFGDTAGVSRQARLSSFAGELSDMLAEKGARFSVYLPVGSLDPPDTPYNLVCYGGNPIDSAAGEIALSMNLAYLPGQGSSPLKTALERAGKQLEGKNTRMLPVLAASGPSPAEQVETLAELGYQEYILY